MKFTVLSCLLTASTMLSLQATINLYNQTSEPINIGMIRIVYDFDSGENYKLPSWITLNPGAHEKIDDPLDALFASCGNQQSRLSTFPGTTTFHLINGTLVATQQGPESIQR